MTGYLLSTPLVPYTTLLSPHTPRLTYRGVRVGERDGEEEASLCAQQCMPVSVREGVLCTLSRTRIGI